MFRRLALVVVLVVSLPAVATAGVGASASPQSVDARTDAVVQRAVDPLASTASAPAAGDSTASASTAQESTGSAATDTIRRTVELSLTPDEPGSVRAVVTYEVPEPVTRVEVSLGDESTVVAADGFERRTDGTYAWTESTSTPTLTLRVDANQTSGGRRTDVGDAGTTSSGAAAGGAAAATADGYVFVDAGSWALVQVPRVGTRWGWTGATDVDLEKDAVVDGAGATGGEMAYLGPVERYTAEGRDERFELVVPERAELNATPQAVLGSLVAASDDLRVDARSEEVFVIAAPEDVDWGIAGLQFGEDDAWVLAGSPVDSPDSVWIHEYIHTRQTFGTTESGRWVTEATADYYAALLAYEQGNASYAAFRRQLERGQRDQYDDDVLAFPQTWSSGANYLKGALAAGAIDLAMRESTNGSASFQTTFRALNTYNGTVSNDVVLDAVGDGAGANVRAYASALTRSDRTAETWDEATHERYFDVRPPVFDVSVPVAGVSTTGPYGERTLGRTRATVVAGETLSVTVAVTNVGWHAGTYSTAMTVNGQQVGVHEGELATGASTTVTFEQPFDDPGTYWVRAGGRTLAVEVVEPPSPTVEDVSVPTTVAAGEAVTLSFAVRNDAPVPGRVVVPVALDGEVLANETVLVPAESSVQRTYTVSFGDPGEHVVSVRDTTVTVQVTGAATTTERTSQGGETTDETLPVPGFGASVALAALAVLALVAVGRARD